MYHMKSEYVKKYSGGTTMKIFKIVGVIVGVLMIISGIYCLFAPELTYLGIGYVIGVSMLLDAIGRIYAWWQYRKAGAADGWMLAGAVLSAVFGFILIGNGAAQLSVDVFIAYMAAIWILAHAIIAIIRSFRARKLHKELNTRWIGRRWWMTLIFGIMLCIFAILSLMNPTIIMAAIGTFIGLGIIVTGADIITIATAPER